jgi:toxin ParE1/3/4
MLRRFDEKVELIASMPGVGADRSDLRPGVRSFPVGSYLIFYRVVEKGIQLLRVVYGARDLRKIFNPD